jgi:DegV family protein with EDD domain
MNTIIVCNFASITEDIIDKYKIDAISTKPYWPEGENLAGGNIYEKMRNARKEGIKTFPKTSQPPLGVFKKLFEEGLGKGENVICITISSKISGTYNSALQAKKLLSEDQQKKMYIIDSNNIDAAETLLAIKAREMDEAGESIENIVKKIEALVPKTYFYGMTESPHQMEAGGRINHVLALVLTQMQKIGMRPILHMWDGVVKPANVRMHAKDTAEAIFKQFEAAGKKHLQEKGRYRIAISHADNLPEAEKLKKLFEEKYPEQVRVEMISMTGIFIGAHVGPGTLMCCMLEE